MWALRSFDPIPVYRGAQMNVIRTFTLSIECLAAGDSILLFPENPTDMYEKKVSDFYEGFANLGRLYHKKTATGSCSTRCTPAAKSARYASAKACASTPRGGADERARNRGCAGAAHACAATHGRGLNIDFNPPRAQHYGQYLPLRDVRNGLQKPRLLPRFNAVLHRYCIGIPYAVG